MFCSYYQVYSGTCLTKFSSIYIFFCSLEKPLIRVTFRKNNFNQPLKKIILYYYLFVR